MTVRRVISQRLFRKTRALKYPVHCNVIASGAPGAPVSTKSGVFTYSVATKGVYGTISTNVALDVGLLGLSAKISTGTL